MRIRNVYLARMVNSAPGERANASLAERTRYQIQQNRLAFHVNLVRWGKVSFQFAVETPTFVAVLVWRVSSALAELAPASGVRREVFVLWEAPSRGLV